MIIVHHLNNSRSQRILWLLEELGLEYEIKFYQRDAVTRLAPPELKAIHPLGKSPVIEHDGRIIAESGAIIDYLARVPGQGRLVPPEGTDAYWQYVHWLHFAEGSAMLPLMLALYTGRLGDAAAPLVPRITSEIDNHFSYMNNALAGKPFFAGQEFSACDAQMSFPVEAAAASGRLASYPHLTAFLARIQARPAYQHALTRGGTYTLGR
jgi:glutathione S-transferase